MRVAAWARLVRQDDGDVADVEGSGVEVLHLFFVRDTMPAILHRLPPGCGAPPSPGEGAHHQTGTRHIA